nr:hypothetical protein [Actinorugispora endophytica]
MFGQNGGLEPKAQYRVVDSSGRERGVYVTDENGDVARTRIEQGTSLSPKTDQLFAENGGLDPDARYEVFDESGRKRGLYVTNTDGGVIEIRTQSGKPGSWNPELRHPRPDMTYLGDDRYTYRTDSKSRTVSMEGNLQLRTGFRGPDQTPIGTEGRDHYEDYHKTVIEKFEEQHGRPRNRERRRCTKMSDGTADTSSARGSTAPENASTWYRCLRPSTRTFRAAGPRGPSRTTSTSWRESGPTPSKRTHRRQCG